MGVWYQGYLTCFGINNNALGFRPIVCLKSGNKLIDNGDETYSIKEPITAKVEYNENTNQIEVRVAYSDNPISKIMLNDTKGLPMTNTNGIITANTAGIALAIGTNTITITDTAGNTKRIEIKVSASSYYGKEVTNYTCASGGVDKWRVYHIDEENIYLIADDYVPYESLPTSINETPLYKGNTDYTAGFGTILNDYTGSAGIIANTDEKAQQWLSKYLSAYPKSETYNMKAVAYMMDTDSWSKFAGEKAEYAIGGPTLEMFCASYEVTHPDKYIVCDYLTSVGYRVRWSNESKNVYNIGGLTLDDFGSIYTKSDGTKAACMWIASPSEYRSDMVMVATYSGGVSYTQYNNGHGFRPVVCLKSGVKLVDNGDGTLSIQ